VGGRGGAGVLVVSSAVRETRGHSNDGGTGSVMKTLIEVAGVVQLLIASANFFLPRKLRYAEKLTRVDTIIRQVFIVPSVYIVLMLAGLAGLCLVFPHELAGASRLGRCLAGFCAVFWGLRVPIQLFYYDPALRRQNLAMHILFSAAFIFLATVFTVAVLR